ncbi:MAG: YegS/Rv2252/BmrU family lipid kinase [Candidatus Heimdallarchaeota archaeon]|nr:YegS/Rv2252/BmrU family lipid kinase [Candidatus Heimdallarchaeota archaeon]MCG3257821.1 YegS/Rv2252/BmrU family lipid kinase [Candidatus Heimdallarchaeota archaeon]MCK4612871.1 YegS/Rv2252/BmrU family lipid kinase [Candidatus Heimdallarchaeota archaeon]
MALKWKFIINPNAGSTLCVKRWEKAEPIVAKSGIDYDVEFTTAPKEGMERVKKAVNEGFNRIIVASGDGVINEAVNGLMQLSEQKRKAVAFGVLPFGTGNDYSTFLGLPWNPENAINTLLNKTKVSPASAGKIEQPDTGGSCFFGNCLDFGISSLVNIANARGEMSWMTGPFKYTLLAIKKLVSVKQIPGVVILDDGEPIDFRLMLLAIGFKALGGGMLVCVDGHPQNDFFDVFITENMSKFQTLIGIKKIHKGDHKYMKNTIYTQAKKIEVKLEKPIAMEHDGEIWEPQDISKHVIATILPKAYNVLYNTEHPSLKWLTKEELEKGVKPDGSPHGMTHWAGRTWQEKN